jgi:tRNA threonylcarbamoyladenosine biosynthesis protein TsaB
VIVLGLDTATSATAVALRLADGTTSEARDDPEHGAHPGHATRLLELTERLLGAAGLVAGDLHRIAVGVGPGTFTGLRVGIATARGLAQSRGVDLVGVSSMRALALPALEGGAGGRSVLAAIDARRREIFAAAYASEGEELAGARPLAPGETTSLLREASLGTGAAGPLAIGDGALRYRTELEGAGIEVAPEGSPLHLLRAAAVCALAVEAGAPESYREVLPEYLRRPDAELALEGAPAGGGSRA